MTAPAGTPAAKAEALNARTNRLLARLAVLAIFLLAATGVTTGVLQAIENRRASEDRQQILRLTREVKDCTTPANKTTDCQQRLSEATQARIRDLKAATEQAATAAAICVRRGGTEDEVRACVAEQTPP